MTKLTNLNQCQHPSVTNPSSSWHNCSITADEKAHLKTIQTCWITEQLFDAVAASYLSWYFLDKTNKMNKFLWIFAALMGLFVTGKTATHMRHSNTAHKTDKSISVHSQLNHEVSVSVFVTTFNLIVYKAVEFYILYPLLLILHQMRFSKMSMTTLHCLLWTTVK